MTQINYQDWVGRTTQAQDVLNSQPARFMQASLDSDPTFVDGDALPPLWHWLYFLEAAKASELGRDAHPKRGGFLPPVALARRMWAGGRFVFHAPLILGARATKTSEILTITEKTGKSGQLCFVTVAHEIKQDGRLCLREEHDIVYREDPKENAPTPSPKPAPTVSDFELEITPTQALLFRYSALTFNGHRIHYDVDYARDVEGYAGLVFHGPLSATLMMKLAQEKSGKPPQSFEFRGLAPLAGLNPFKIMANASEDKMDLWVRRHDGAMAMSAKVVF